MFFKGAVKYILYVFIGAWMFLLGIMVGRETAPVTFDTRGFQEWLQAIVQESGTPERTHDQEGRIALRYYDTLNSPVEPEDLAIPIPDKGLEATLAQSGEAAVEHAGSVPVKTSMKAATFARKSFETDAVAETRSVPRDLNPPGTGDTPGSGAAYTLQVAAFKSLKDAVTQMSILAEKGFTAARSSKKIDGITWYRVRSGAFTTRDAASRYLEKLNQAGINGMIIREEQP